jgi:tRNA pseudouridine38-40 synthase
MRNFKVMMAYDGTAYHGFQRQENAIAIQQIIEETIESIIGEKTVIYGCSRTDTGVHANQYCFNFLHSNSITPHGFVRSMNSLLPDDMAIKSCEEVDESFHARYHCKGKEYKYIIHNSSIKDPFLKDMAFRYHRHIDEKLLNSAAQYFAGTHDFKSLCSSGSSSINTVRTINKIEVSRDGDIVTLTVSGDGFLYNMVRIIVGTLIFVNEGKIKPSQIPEILEGKDRKHAGKTAPACGLYLNRLFYDN